MDIITKFTDDQLHELHENAEEMFREVYVGVASLPKSEWPIARIAYLNDLKKKIAEYEQEIDRRKSRGATLAERDQDHSEIKAASHRTPGKRAARIFISYSHADESYKKKLEQHLALLKRLGIVETWSDRDLKPGQEWNDQIRSNLNGADIVLILVSASFLASDYAYEEEMLAALKQTGKAVVPIILSPVVWKLAPFARFQALPEDARPVSTWQNQDEAWAQIAGSLRRLVQAMGLGL
jgi:hypothetical protein